MGLRCHREEDFMLNQLVVPISPAAAANGNFTLDRRGGNCIRAVSVITQSSETIWYTMPQSAVRF